MKKLPPLNTLSYVIIRGFNSGVFAGYLLKRKGKEVMLLQARRLWQWAGANSISQLATNGTAKPNECRFPVEVFKIEILDAIEVVYCTEESRLSIASVPIWTAK